MVLFNLLAKLTLNKSAFDTDLDSAQAKANNFTMPTQELQLKVDNFDKDLAAAQTSSSGFTGPKADDLTLKTADFDSALKQAEDGSSQFKQIWGDLVVAVASAGITATISGVISYLGTAVDAFMNAGQRINDTSKAWGISAEAYQEWAHALGGSRADIKDFEGGIKNINKLLGGDATDKVAGAFGKLGIEASDANGQLKTTEQLLSETVNALADYKENDRGALVETIFGSRGANINQLLDKGTTGIKKLINESHTLGLVMSDEQIETALAYDQAMNNLHDAMASFQASIGESIVPGLTNVVELMTKIVTFFGGGSRDDGLQKTLEGITTGLVGESEEAETTAEEAKGLVDQLWSIADASEKTVEQQELFKSLADDLIKKIPELSEYINKDTMELTGNKDEIYNTITAWKEYQKQRALVAAQEEAGRAVEEKQTEYYKARADAIIAENRESAIQTRTITNLNEILKKYGVTDFSFSKDSSYMGANLELRDFLQSTSYAALRSQGTAGSLVSELEGAMEGWEDASDQADTMTTKAEDLKAELDEVQAGWEEYNNALIAAASESETAVTTTNTALDQTETEAAEATSQVDALNSALDTLQSKSPVTIAVNSDFGVDGFSNAKGNWSVPYDDFPAILHRGEAVLTASQARKYREGTGEGVDMSGISSAIVTAIRDGMNGAVVNSFLDGKRVTKNVNRRTMNELKARRFAP